MARYVVTGRITNRQEQPLANLVVLAFDQRPRGPEHPLGGEARTNRQGQYRLEFEFDPRSAGGSPNLLIRVFDERKQIGMSEVQRDAGESTKIDLVLDYRPNSGQAAESVRSYTVNGHTVQMSGARVPRQQLFAYDVDLRGVAVYQQVDSLGAIKRSGGFEFLSQVQSDRDGFYEFSFTHDQFQKSERKLADVVVYAVINEQIVGRSRLAKSSDFSKSGEVRDLLVVIDRAAEGVTEYELTMPPLVEFLKENELQLAQIAASQEQIAFVADELNLAESHVQVAVQADVLTQDNGGSVLHELLYGVGRQKLELTWPALYATPFSEIRAALERSIRARIIRKHDDAEIDKFLERLRGFASKEILQSKPVQAHQTDQTLDERLKVVLPDEVQRRGYVDALNAFEGDFDRFWTDYLPKQEPFKQNPDLVKGLMLNTQLAVLTGSFTPLVGALQKEQGVKSPVDLLRLKDDEWRAILKKTGVPQNVSGDNEEQRIDRYQTRIQRLLHAAYPTETVRTLLEQETVGIDDAGVRRGVQTFLAKTPRFDIARSNVADFEAEIADTNPQQAAAVTATLRQVQRLYQLSPTPEAIGPMMKAKLDSAHAIASIPEKTFLQQYSEALGGTPNAYALYQRAAYLDTRNNHIAAAIHDTVYGANPRVVRDGKARALVLDTVAKHLPNYETLFGAPNICECEHCRSVYSPAAYFVDLLQFLKRSGTNAVGKSPLTKLAERRPDLLHLALTCENTHTVIPYIDLANEIMEYYTAHGQLDAQAAHNTEETSAAELRANPQNTMVDAYRKLAGAVFPFTLPYHQPLDVSRVFLGHLKTTRAEILRSLQVDFSATTENAIAAESLGLAQEQYRILTNQHFDGTAHTVGVHTYFGYSAAGDLEDAAVAQTFIRRAGIAYTDLIEIVKTRFVNPHQGLLDFLEELFAGSTFNGPAVYEILARISSGALLPADDAELMAVLTAAGISAGDFLTWVKNHFANLQRVITLYAADASCDLTATYLRVLKNVYEGVNASGLNHADWSRLHRFIRLWRQLNWSIQEVDQVLTSLQMPDITDATIRALASIVQLNGALKLPPEKLAVLWGNIPTTGEKSLYAKLFLNKAVQRIDDAFQPDAWGNYLADEGELLIDHVPALLAAFRVSEVELYAYAAAAHVDHGGSLRPLDLATDRLTLPNVSVLYRHVLLADATKYKAADFVQLLKLVGIDPFSRWDVANVRFTQIDPAATLAFTRLVQRIKDAKFKAATLNYILTGNVPPDSSLPLTEAKVLQAAKDIRAALSAIDQAHPAAPPSPITLADITNRLALVFPPEVVGQMAALLGGTASYATTTEANLPLEIPADLRAKVTYVKGSGRLISSGILTDGEKAQLEGLAGATPAFRAAVDELYAAPEAFLAATFDDVFADMNGAKAVLLDHPAQPAASTLDAKLNYVYQNFIPLLKANLRRQAMVQTLADLIGLDAASTAVLLGAELDHAAASLADSGFAATYFSDNTFTTAALHRTDRTIDVVWSAAPDPALPAGGFSVRWEGYVSPPVSGEYTLQVQVQQPGQSFKLYLNDELVLEKTPANALLAWEVVVAWNSSLMNKVRLEAADIGMGGGVHLSWKVGAGAMTVVPAEAVFPLTTIATLTTLAGWSHRAAKLIQQFDLRDVELAHLTGYGANFGNLDFKALTLAHWQHLDDYVAVRNAIPNAQATLITLLDAANRPPVALAYLESILQLATAWDLTSIQTLNQWFSFGVDDFKNGAAVRRLHTAMRLIGATGASAASLTAWATPTTDFDALDAAAQAIKNSVKAKYEESDWLEIAAGLTDVIRGHQRDALIAYLLMQPELQAWGVYDADSLYEYFLIDVQMGACMDTSRIVQANSSVQLFVIRCLLNLESNQTAGGEQGVSPAAIDVNRWEWMKNYRVWEANRKVFLYPENWLEPEWRDDRSPFFMELESELVQNDISPRSVEEAFRNYLAKLDEVARMDVVAMYRDTATQITHVVARTQNAPYKYYYRTLNKYEKWSAWEQVQVDIRSVEDGEDSGVHLIPVVWKERLFLFWAEFTEVQKQAPGASSGTVEEMSTKNVSSLKPHTDFEIRLAWSEYVDRKWTPKQVSKEFIKIFAIYEQVKDYTFGTYIDPATNELTVSLHNFFGAYYGAFRLADIRARVEIIHLTYNIAPLGGSTYDLNYMKHTRGAANLTLASKTYLKSIVDHELVYSNQIALPTNSYLDYYSTLVAGFRSEFANFRVYRPPREYTTTHPFFYQDARRTYYVKPVKVSVYDWVVHPERYHPILPEIEKYFPPEIDYWEDPMGPVITFDPRIPVIRDGDGPVLVEPHIAVEEVVRGDGGLPSHAALAYRTTATPGFGAVPETGSMRTLSLQAQAGTTKQAMTIAAPFGGASVVESVAVGQAHLGLGAQLVTKVQSEQALRFYTFYHPYTANFVTNLNQNAIGGLLASDLTIPSDNGVRFETTYNPTLKSSVVQKPSDFAQYSYYKEDVSYDDFNAYSLYNWELFFHGPLYVATRLSKNGQFAEAMKWFHYIFDPFTDESSTPGAPETSRYWKVLPFKTTEPESLEAWFMGLLPNPSGAAEDPTIAEWRDYPFRPHLVARNRPIAYMKHVVIKYVENLIAWGDSLFRQDTMESINEALQLYVMANHILGPRPEFVPQRGEIQAETYSSLEPKLDDFSNALVQLENIFPFAGEIPAADSSYTGGLLGVGPALYFCIPNNDKLLGYWDTVADRLYKIRNCMNIEGVRRSLALFAPPIDPGMLIQATAAGLSLSSVLALLSTPAPIYRFRHLIVKANEFCAEVKLLGSLLLAAIEKRDLAELERINATHGLALLQLLTAVKDRQVLDAKAGREILIRARTSARFRMRHFENLLGNELVEIPSVPTLAATLNADSALPADTVIPTIATDVDDELVESDESGLKLINKEQEDLGKTNAAKWFQAGAGAAETLAGILALFPQVDGEGTPLGVGVGAWWGGQNLGAASSALGRALQTAGNFLSLEAAQAFKTATYIRREQEWTLQANLAAKEIIQIDKQITVADLRIQAAEKELERHHTQITQAEEIEQYLRDKFSNTEFYQWLKEQLFAVYQQAYNLAYDMALKAEQAYRYEIGDNLASFIQVGYWESARQGLMSGERLQLALKQMEKSYIEENKRELEMTKHVSLALLNPLALQQLKETGSCFFSLPEEAYDLDFQGHYFRRIKSVSMSIPCIVGPFTTVSATLRLLENSIRINTLMNADGNYEHNHDEGVLIDDDRFRSSNVPVKAIATSTGQLDPGLFRLDFGDDRYLPFEGSGAISEWKLELAADPNLRQFDYATIADVIVHVSYTAREDAGLFRSKTVAYLNDYISNVAELSTQPFMRMFSLKQEFATQWHRFLYPPAAGGEQLLTFTIGKARLPFFAQHRKVHIMKVEVLARTTKGGDYHAILAATDEDGDPMTSTQLTLAPNPIYGGLQKVTLTGSGTGVNVEEIDIDGAMSIKLKHNAAADFTALATDPEEVKDLLIVFHYYLEDL